MNETLVFVDNGFFKLVKKNFDEKRGAKSRLLTIFRNICSNENLQLKHLFFYTAPPYQSMYPNKTEVSLKRGYDTLRKLFSYKKWITLREGRCQRLKIDGVYRYNQKGVDILLTIDLMRFDRVFKNIHTIILIACDSDFVPVIEKLKEEGIQVILYTYFDRKRHSAFSRYNELLQVSSRWVRFRGEDFV